MVPAADVLNHLANHNANLEYSPVSGSVPVLVLMCLDDWACDSNRCVIYAGLAVELNTPFSSY